MLTFEYTNLSITIHEEIVFPAVNAEKVLKDSR